MSGFWDLATLNGARTKSRVTGWEEEAAALSKDEGAEAGVPEGKGGKPSLWSCTEDLPLL